MQSKCKRFIFVGIGIVMPMMHYPPWIWAKASLEETSSVSTKTIPLENKRTQHSEEQKEDAVTPWQWNVGTTLIAQFAPNTATTTHSPASVCTMDIQAQTKMNHKSVFQIVLETGNGTGMDAEIENLSGFNHAVINHTSMLYSESWYERKWDTQGFVRIGKLDFSRLFDANAVANDEHIQFLSSSFVNNRTIAWPNEHGLALALQQSFSSNWHVRAGITDAQGSWEHAFSNPFGIVELHTQAFWAGNEGNYRMILWGREDPIEERNSKSFGFATSLDQKIFSHCAGFLRFGYVHSKTLPVQTALSGGMAISGKVFGRPLDALAVAIGVLKVPRSDVVSNHDTQTKDNQREIHVETYYLWAFSEKIMYTVDMQVNLQYREAKVVQSNVVIGMRFRISF